MISRRRRVFALATVLLALAGSYAASLLPAGASRGIPTSHTFTGSTTPPLSNGGVFPTGVATDPLACQVAGRANPPQCVIRDAPLLVVSPPNHILVGNGDGLAYGNGWFPPLNCSAKVQLTLTDAAGKKYSIGQFSPHTNPPTISFNYSSGAVPVGQTTTVVSVPSTPPADVQPGQQPDLQGFGSDDQIVNVNALLAYLRDHIDWPALGKSLLNMTRSYFEGQVAVPYNVGGGAGTVDAKQSMRFKLPWTSCFTIVSKTATVPVSVTASPVDPTVITKLAVTTPAGGVPAGSPATVSWVLSRGGEVLVTLSGSFPTASFPVSTIDIGHFDAGTNSFTFTPVLDGLTLPPGSYVLRLDLVDSGAAAHPVHGVSPSSVRPAQPKTTTFEIALAP